MAITVNSGNDFNYGSTGNIPDNGVFPEDNNGQGIEQPNIPGVNPLDAPAGLSGQELNDPNNIVVTVSDPNTPIIVLYGPPSCGKTMTLVRMARYLSSMGYAVVPERTFRPAYDTNYRELCDNFDQMINSNSAATSTNRISFMLVKVLKNGRPICQILEAPGEYYFNPDEPNKAYPAYVYSILNSSNRKVWAIMVEPDWSDLVPRNNYVTRIRNLKANMSTRDKVLFVYNKIDLTPFVKSVGQVDMAQAIANIQNLYPNIFVPFENQNPLTKWFTKYNCEFVPFMTGSYSRTMSGGLTYIECHPSYAKRLWEAMLKMING